MNEFYKPDKFLLFQQIICGAKGQKRLMQTSQTKMLVCGMLVTSLPQVCASLLQSKHDCISKCLWLRMRA